MIIYLDASVVVALLTHDAFTARAEKFLVGHQPIAILSDLASAEFAGVIARRVRTKTLSEVDARATFSAFDAWSADAVRRVECSSADIAMASVFIRRLDLPLRTPDAIHIAIAQRTGAILATFDTRMADSAAALGLAVAPA